MSRTVRLAIETPELQTRVGVARHKPCPGCGRSWDECGGGWMEFGGDGQLAASWRCDDCTTTVEVRTGAAGWLADLLDMRRQNLPATTLRSGIRAVTSDEAIGILSVGLWLAPG